MSTRTQIRDDGVTRVFEIRDDAGQLVCTSYEPAPGTAPANAETIQQRATTALTANATFLAIGSPSVAQLTTQLQNVTKECSAVIRLLLSRLDDTAGT